MSQTWTKETVLQLARDAKARARVLALACPQRWQGLFASRDTGFLWGQLQGTSAEPYQCLIDLEAPVQRCSCPSKKRPCKHVLALMLLFVEDPNRFIAAVPPAEVCEWIAQCQLARQAPRQKHIQTEKDLQTRQKRAAQEREKREIKAQQAVDELERWLLDLAEQGFGSAREQPAHFWSSAARRLVNQKLPGFARRIRSIEAAARGGPGWQDRMLEEVAYLYLALAGYRQLAKLPPGLQADMRTAAGWKQNKKDLGDLPGVTDQWLVLGCSVEESADLLVQRTWLLGAATRHPALLLSFGVNGALPAVDAVPGQALTAELVYYPSAYPLRAEMRARQQAQPLPAQLPAHPTMAQALADYAAALACHPLLERFPMALQAVQPAPYGEGWVLIDQDDRGIPVRGSFPHGWELMAISGGSPVPVFGEWNGKTYLPLSVWSDGGFHAFAPDLGD